MGTRCINEKHALARKILFLGVNKRSPQGTIPHKSIKKIEEKVNGCSL